jgi:hypothetical protein
MIDHNCTSTFHNDPSPALPLEGRERFVVDCKGLCFMAHILFILVDEDIAVLFWQKVSLPSKGREAFIVDWQRRIFI